MRRSVVRVLRFPFFRGLLGATLLVGTLPQDARSAPTCSRVLGFSVTVNWYVADGSRNLSGFERIIGQPQAWELQARGGQEIRDWGPGGSGWSTQLRYASCAGAPSRIVLQVATSRPESDAQVASALARAVDEVHRRFPHARLDLIPIPGGPGCGTYAESIRDQMADAISDVVRSGDAFEGPETAVSSCGMFADDRGHLTPTGGVDVAKQVASFYG
jgi:hypothetical protein